MRSSSELNVLFLLTGNLFHWWQVEALRAMLVLIYVFWNMTPCRQTSDLAVY